MKTTISILSLATLFLVGCQEEGADLPEPTRYGEFDRAPQVLFRQPTETVVAYLENFKNLADSTEAAAGNRILQIRDQDRILTAVVNEVMCNEVHVSGRIGDSIFPKSAIDFIKLRDAYGGAGLYWALLEETPNYGEGGATLGGRQSWESLDGTATAEVTWRFDEPDGRNGNYEMEFRNSGKISAPVAAR
ncbi:MAG: hypothetical protein AAGH89_12175 [Verrucomicrobiota bacterium]